MPTVDEVRQAIVALKDQGAHVSPTTIRQQLGGRVVPDGSVQLLPQLRQRLGTPRLPVGVAERVHGQAGETHHSIVRAGRLLLVLADQESKDGG